jgi:hypothetical protein
MDGIANAAWSSAANCPPIYPHPPARLQVSAGWEAGAEVGPVISPQAKQRIERLVESGIQQVHAVLCMLCVERLARAFPANGSKFFVLA